MPFRVPAASACQRVPQIDRFQGVTTAQEGGLCQSFARSGKPFLCNGLCSRRSVAAGMSRTGWVPLTFPEYAGLDGPNAAIASALGVYGLDAIRVRLAGLGRLADQAPPGSAVPLHVPHADAPGSGTATHGAAAEMLAERKETDAVSLRADVAHRRKKRRHAALGDADGADLPVEAGEG